MSTANRIGGLLTLRVDGVKYEARGNFQVTGMVVKREGVAGQDNVHGYIETPIVPQIKGDLSIGNLLSIEQLENITDASAQISLANERTYALINCWSTGASVIDAHDGKVELTLEGREMQEL